LFNAHSDRFFSESKAAGAGAGRLSLKLNVGSVLSIRDI